MSGGLAGFNPRDKDRPGYSEDELWGPNGRSAPTSFRASERENALAILAGERAKQRAEEPWEWEPGWTFDPATGRPIPPPKRNLKGVDDGDSAEDDHDDRRGARAAAG